jgi:regulator of RNase E activity RraA
MVTVAVLGVNAAARAMDATGAFDQVIATLRAATVASVCDAVDQVTGRRGFMAHDMRPLAAAYPRMVGPAVTALIVPAVGGASAAPSNHILLAIDEAPAGCVLVVVVKDDLNITGIGGLMATACKARGLAGAVIDGAARDVEEINRLALPVFSRSISPASIVGRYQSIARNCAVACAGVTVTPGDIIVAGVDGVVVVPRAQAAAVATRAREIDEKETSMVPVINATKSIRKTVEEFNRL